MTSSKSLPISDLSFFSYKMGVMRAVLPASETNDKGFGRSLKSRRESWVALMDQVGWGRNRGGRESPRRH